MPSWLQVRIAANFFCSSSSQIAMSIFVSVIGLRVRRVGHTVELEAVAAVEKAAVAQAEILQRLDLFDLTLLARLKIASRDCHTMIELSSQVLASVLIVATDMASSSGCMVALVFIRTGILVLSRLLLRVVVVCVVDVYVRGWS
jgi:hypothetical protein